MSLTDYIDFTEEERSGVGYSADDRVVTTTIYYGSPEVKKYYYLPFYDAEFRFRVSRGLTISALLNDFYKVTRTYGLHDIARKEFKKRYRVERSYPRQKIRINKDCPQPNTWIIYYNKYNKKWTAKRVPFDKNVPPAGNYGHFNTQKEAITHARRHPPYKYKIMAAR